MDKKRVSIPVLLFSIICTALCTVIASQWYFIKQDGDKYRTQLAGEVVSNDGRQLTIKGQVTNPKGQNGTYVVKYHTGLTVYDSARNEINFSDLQPGSPISVYYHWNIPKYVSPRTEFDELFALEESQQIPDVSAIALLGDDESAKSIDCFNTNLTTP